MKVYAPGLFNFEFFNVEGSSVWHLRTWSSLGKQQHVTEIPLSVGPSLSKQSNRFWVDVPATEADDEG